MFITLGDGFTAASIEAAHAAAAAAAAVETGAARSSRQPDQRAQSGQEEGKWRAQSIKPGLVLDFAQRCGKPY